MFHAYGFEPPESDYAKLDLSTTAKPWEGQELLTIADETVPEKIALYGKKHLPRLDAVRYFRAFV